jgi:D-xylose transport system ATP-binding protein
MRPCPSRASWAHGQGRWLDRFRAMSPLLNLERIIKEFPGVQAVRDVSLSLYSGEVLAVVGENGAGKSTLMRVAAGVYPVHSYGGTVRLAGETLSLHTVSDAERAGISLVSQEVQVVPAMTVAENIFLNRELGFPLRTREMLTRSVDLLRRFGFAIDPAIPIGRLGVGQQQMVMLARALAHEARVIIFDEPTASLSGQEVGAFFDMVRRLTAAQVGCVFVSHRIDEVFEIADRIAVMRNGELVSILPKQATSPREIVALMVGRDLGAMYQRHPSVIGPTVLELSHYFVASPRDPARLVVTDVSLEVRSGEIVGLFGLVGAGRTELASALVGAWPGRHGGDVKIAGRAALITSPKDAAARHMALLTEDRRRFGLFANMNLRDNVNLGSLERVSRWQVLDDRQALIRTAQLGQQLRIRAPSWLAPVTNLSGGNQQKVLLARLLAMKPAILVLDEPTRGIDIGAKAEIFALLDDLTRQGLGVLLISSELQEVIAMSDRIVVLYKGRVTAAFSDRPFDERRVLEAATGGEAVGVRQESDTHGQVE